MTNTEQPGLDAVESGEYLLIPKATVDFLTGAKPDESGQWFGDQPKGPRRQFWWREKLNNLQPAPDTVGAPGEAMEKRPYAFGIEARDGRHLYWDEELCAHHAEQQNVEYFGLYRRSALLATPLQLDEDRSLRELGKSLVGIIEGINGTMNHGTFRGEKSGLRLKDTPEWVAFYVALSALSKRAGEREGIAVSGIHLMRLGDHVVVNAEVGGRWVEVIREHHEGAFSHIVETGGIEAAALKRPDKETAHD